VLEPYRPAVHALQAAPPGPHCPTGHGISDDVALGLLVEVTVGLALGDSVGENELDGDVLPEALEVAEAVGVRDGETETVDEADTEGVGVRVPLPDTVGVMELDAESETVADALADGESVRDAVGVEVLDDGADAETLGLTVTVQVVVGEVDTVPEVVALNDLVAVAVLVPANVTPERYPRTTMKARGCQGSQIVRSCKANAVLRRRHCGHCHRA
jgi:hypothetical protein